MVQFLERVAAPNLAYIKTDSSGAGSDLPAVVFLGGFRSDMEGTKAIYLENKCKERGQAYVRFDYRGHGKSEGKFEEACISEWAQDAADILDHCISGDVILVGSSMGGWLSLLLGQKNPARIKAIIGLAAAPDFTTWMEAAMSDAQRGDLSDKGFFELPNDYDDAPYIITKKLIDDGRNNILLNSRIELEMPVRLIQGMKDADVEWQVAHRIKNAITGDDVEVILLEEADHRLSTPDQLEVLNQTLEKLL